MAIAAVHTPSNETRSRRHMVGLGKGQIVPMADFSWGHHSLMKQGRDDTWWRTILVTYTELHIS
ncbi:hypothetical protein Syun_012985 [Stephania yunnanensis]|uniref:Uncharacterized protein n=1 Tax=Stephania yunnanensis TaxID=152371 RepID=A0AAP0K1H4_9MAGN